MSALRDNIFLLVRFVALLAVLVVGSVSAQDRSGVSLPGFPGAETLASDTPERSTTYPLITGPVTQSGGIDANLDATRTLDGALSRRTYRAPAEADAQAVFNHYRKALVSADFEILYQCQGRACGGLSFIQASPGHRVRPALFGPDRPSYIAARRNRDAGDVYVAVQVAAAETVGSSVRVQVDRLTVKPREIATITVDAEEMARQLRDTGRVALYGIYFETDSARLRPSSEPTISEIARLMDNRPELRLLVVGHTDTRGSFDYNIDLSQRRAASVVSALVEDHGIDNERLKPWGVGFTVPDDKNTTRFGRSRNRRVELVTW